MPRNSSCLFLKDFERTRAECKANTRHCAAINRAHASTAVMTSIARISNKTNSIPEKIEHWGNSFSSRFKWERYFCCRLVFSRDEVFAAKATLDERLTRCSQTWHTPSSFEEPKTKTVVLLFLDFAKLCPTCLSLIGVSFPMFQQQSVTFWCELKTRPAVRMSCLA